MDEQLKEIIKQNTKIRTSLLEVLKENSPYQDVYDNLIDAEKDEEKKYLAQQK